MKKRFVVTAVTASVILASCGIDQAGKESELILRFAEPLSNLPTRATGGTDTNSFILSVTGIGGETIYKGAYGSRPRDLAVKAGTYEGIRVVSPYCDITKRDIALRGKAIGLDYSLTYSCYKGGEKHCGKCGTCTERKEALEGFDPTEYEA